MGGRNYNHRLALAQVEPGRIVVRPGLVEALAALRCDQDEHQTETDPDTGDEVCRWCTRVIT